jgi:GTP-binding protein
MKRSTKLSQLNHPINHENKNDHAYDDDDSMKKKKKGLSLVLVKKKKKKNNLWMMNCVVWMCMLLVVVWSSSSSSSRMVEALSAKVTTTSSRAGVSSSGNLGKKNDPEWKFLDTARVHVSGGDGGNGCVAFRREKGAPLGGPSGGRGGNGGSIYLKCDASMNTLANLRNSNVVHYRGKPGKNGIGKNKDGAHAEDLYVPVPPGTLVRELHSQKLAGELRDDGETLLVSKGGRGGRGNAAFLTPHRTSPKLCERGQPGAERWLSLELRLLADVGLIGKPNAGKSTLLAASTQAKPKIANYPFTTIVPNLGVCDETGMVLCDIPGLLEGASEGVGMGFAFLRHIQRCQVLLHILDMSSEDVIADYLTIQQELKQYDDKFLEDRIKPQVIVLNKIDVFPEGPERDQAIEDITQQLKQHANHTRILPISAATTTNVPELMNRLKKFMDAQQKQQQQNQNNNDLPAAPEIDFSKTGLECDSDDYEIISDPAYPGQWRVKGEYIEQVAKMTHWEYPEAVERFGRILNALGIADELQALGATDNDLVMVDEYDFDFAPKMTNPYIPSELLERDYYMGIAEEEPEKKNTPYIPYGQGGFLEDDIEEIMGFEEDGWDLLDDMDDEDFNNNGQFEIRDDDEIWQS